MQIILRIDAGGFQAGDVLDVIQLPAESQCLVAGTDRTAWVPSAAVLPLEELYQRQPKKQFLTLARITEDHRMEWLQSPHDVVFGPRPFRFESAGEAVFFLRHANHGCPLILVGRYRTTNTEC